MAAPDPTSPAVTRPVAVWGEKILIVAAVGGILVWTAFALAPAAWLAWAASLVAVLASIGLARRLPVGTLLPGLRAYGVPRRDTDS